jgi:hypothetical protein
MVSDSSGEVRGAGGSATVHPYSGGRRQGVLFLCLVFGTLAVFSATFGAVHGRRYDRSLFIVLGLMLGIAFAWLTTWRQSWTLQADGVSVIALGHREHWIPWESIRTISYVSSPVGWRLGILPVMTVEYQSRRMRRLKFKPLEMSAESLVLVLNYLTSAVDPGSLAPELWVLFDLATRSLDPGDSLGTGSAPGLRTALGQLNLGRIRNAAAALPDDSTITAGTATVLCEALILVGDYQRAERLSDWAGDKMNPDPWLRICRAVALLNIASPDAALAELTKTSSSTEYAASAVSSIRARARAEAASRRARSA